MLFHTWITRTNGFKPKCWTDNPASATALFDANPDELPSGLTDCQKIACDFNNAELKSPLGVWAVIIPTEQSEKISACNVIEIRRATDLN